MSAQGADQTIEGHGRDSTYGCTPFQAETTVGGDQGLPSDIGTHTAITQDEMRQHGKDRPASGARNAPDGETAQTHSHIMRVASQRAVAITGRFVMKLETDGEDKGQHELDERLAIAQEL